MKISKLATRIQSLFSRYGKGELTELIPKSLPLRKRLKRLTAFSVIRVIYPFVKRLHGKISAFQIDRGIIHPKFFIDCIDNALQRIQWEPDLLFVMYMDTFVIRQSAWLPFYNKLPLPFGGISFDPAYNDQSGNNPEEPYWNMDTFCGLCLTDENKKNVYDLAHPDKVFITIPDITNCQLLEPTPEIVRQIHKKANGRTIVILGGSIEFRKNVRLFLQLVSIADSQEYFFVLAGQLHLQGFTSDEIALLNGLETGQRENVYTCFRFFDDERELNCLFAASDIIFAVYRDFQKSSNLLTKAAFFEKPILVSRKYLMGIRVKFYKIGLTVDEDDSVGALQAIEHLRLNPIPSTAYAAYRADFNETAMGDALEQFISKSLRMQEEIE